MYCLDYDGLPPGHCCTVNVKYYAIMNVDGNLHDIFSICDCQGKTDNSRPCGNPTHMGGGEYGIYSVSGSGQGAGASAGSDTCKGDTAE